MPSARPSLVSFFRSTFMDSDKKSLKQETLFVSTNSRDVLSSALPVLLCECTLPPRGAPAQPRSTHVGRFDVESIYGVSPDSDSFGCDRGSGCALALDSGCALSLGSGCALAAGRPAACPRLGTSISTASVCRHRVSLFRRVGRAPSCRCDPPPVVGSLTTVDAAVTASTADPHRNLAILRPRRHQRLLCVHRHRRCRDADTRALAGRQRADGGILLHGLRQV